MKNIGIKSSYTLKEQGFHHLQSISWNLSPSVLIEEVIQHKEGHLVQGGSLAVDTEHTGRSANDKYIVQYAEEVKTSDEAMWWTPFNQPLSPQKFDILKQKMLQYLEGKRVYVQDMQVGSHPVYHVPIRIITEYAWHSLMAWNMFVRLQLEKIIHHKPAFTVLDCPSFYADPPQDGTNSETFIAVDFKQQLILIGGTSYAGEIKKSIFTLMNYLMPAESVLSMHCAANVGPGGDVALFFGLSGTGKTTLSSDPERSIIGDDEHGWADDGVFNFEGGCYAKTIRLRSELEPIIWSACHRSGTVLENVLFDPITREVDFDSAEKTENTRASYPLDFIPRRVTEGRAGHPRHIFLLTADAFGVLPLLAKLSLEQAIYYFFSGYTSKLAGTETGLGLEPKATFSACFGAPFIPLYPWVYAKLLSEKIIKHHTQVWLINTGWTDGPYGVGRRIQLPYTRAMVRAVLTNKLDNIPMQKDVLFGLSVPEACPGVPDEVLSLESTWRNSQAYQQQARELVKRFSENFKQFSGHVLPEIMDAGAKL
jgi:phosphoenolpyruvate carboxykinase (ATP)